MNEQEFFFKHLCEYYNVSIEEAIKLGSRSTGRKPDLPSSETCEAVSDMTFEDIWDSQKRESQEDVFKFYKDQGAWSAFRQCVRLRESAGAYQHYLLSPLNKIEHYMRLGREISICEYGCGTAPFSYLLSNAIKDDVKFKIFLSDVDCEHFNFGIWRLEQVKKERKLSNLEIIPKVVKPNELPTYDDELDIVYIFEVLEHVPDPPATAKNLFDQMSNGSFFVENFVKHEGLGDLNGPDLLSARKKRDEYLQFLNNNMSLELGDEEKKSPSGTRIWYKR